MIFVVFGPGGVGKGTVVRRLVEADPQLWLSRSWTTRARRPGEDPDAYTWVTPEEFRRHIEGGGFLEWAQFLDHLYGTPFPEPPPGRDVLLEIDLQGAVQVRRRDPEAVVILLVPPSPEVQADRLRRRGDPEDQIARRLAVAEGEVGEGTRLADHVVVNDDLERAVEEVAGIIRSHRSAGPDAADRERL
ncbi:MAG TPA: guanylate kinase [Acidimicrobiales bacterium]|nr:guanylate kinase [Acidimicrobiales bacterium]